MDEARDVVSYADVTKVPTYQCYFDGQLVDSYEGTAPSAMRDFVNRNIREYCNRGLPLWQKLFVVAAAAFAGWIFRDRLADAIYDLFHEKGPLERTAEKAEQVAHRARSLLD